MIDVSGVVYSGHLGTGVELNQCVMRRVVSWLAATCWYLSMMKQTQV